MGPDDHHALPQPAPSRLFPQRTEDGGKANTTPACVFRWCMHRLEPWTRPVLTLLHNMHCVSRRRPAVPPHRGRWSNTTPAASPLLHDDLLLLLSCVRLILTQVRRRCAGAPPLLPLLLCRPHSRPPSTYSTWPDMLPPLATCVQLTSITAALAAFLLLPAAPVRRPYCPVPLPSLLRHM